MKTAVSRWLRQAWLQENVWCIAGAWSSSSVAFALSRRPYLWRLNRQTGEQASIYAFPPSEVATAMAVDPKSGEIFFTRILLLLLLSHPIAVEPRIKQRLVNKQRLRNALGNVSTTK